MYEATHPELSLRDAIMIILEHMAKGYNVQFSWEGYPFQVRDSWMLELQADLTLKLANMGVDPSGDHTA
jgi:hypothetical protein